MFRIMFSVDLQLIECLCRLQPYVLRIICVCFAYNLRTNFHFY